MNAVPAHSERVAIGAAVDALPVGVAVTRAGSTIEYANRHLSSLLGLTPEELRGLDLARFRWGAAPRLRLDIRTAVLAGETWQGEIALHTRHAPPLHALETCYPSEDGAAPPQVVHFFHELGVLRSAAALSRLAFRDAVTGLPTRSLLEEMVLAQIAAAPRDRAGFGVLYADIEHLNGVNAVLDRDAGDELLRLMSARIRAVLRAGDVLGRVGGDELAAIVPGTGDDAAIFVGEKLRRACNGWFEAAGKEYPVRVSVGSSVYPGDGESVDALFRRAEAAMYRIKAADREISGLLTRRTGAEYVLRR